MGKKLIEVAPFLPLDAISVASKADKDKKTGTTKNVHKWFAPMPTPALRALIFAAVVDAPDDEGERQRLLDLVERLVPSDGNPPDAKVLAEAKAEILASNGGVLPIIFDPFCGGGSTLIEAQRLGLNAMGSDLNPVPVLITRTLTELIPQVAGRPALVGDTGTLGTIGGGPLAGLFADVKHYAEQVRAQVWDEVGHLYPTGPSGETVMCLIWAWTVSCINPACGADVPLYDSPWLGRKKGAEKWVVPILAGEKVSFKVGSGPGTPPAGTKVGQAKFRCLVCGTVLRQADVHRQIDRHDGKHTLMAAIANNRGQRVFLDADTVRVEVPPSPAGLSEAPSRGTFGSNAQGGRYGFERIVDHFNTRQQTMLSSFAQHISTIGDEVDAAGADQKYRSAVMAILGLAMGRLAQASNMQVRWKLDSRNGSASAQSAFGTHAVQMVWTFTETNPFGGSVGDWQEQFKSIFRGLASLPTDPEKPAKVHQRDARALPEESRFVLVTDPPYFNQVAYADLADHMYVWIRAAIQPEFPDLLATIATPKSEELAALEHRHKGSQDAAYTYFVDGFTQAFGMLKTAASLDHPILVVYAHRQEETTSLGSASTGWDAMLEAILAAGLVIEGTLPIRGTGSSRQISQGTNALAAYTVMVCRPRTTSGSPGTIADLRSALRSRLPAAVDALLATGESMVDIRQAAIGPGMEAYSQFSAVFDGSEPIRVHRALSIINEELGRLLNEQLGVVDDDSRWACDWYADHQYELGDYDTGRQLAQTYGLGVNGLEDAGIVEQGRGKIRLLPRDELPGDWTGAGRTPVWEACQHLVKRLTDGATAGEGAAAELLTALGPKAAGVRELAQYLTNLAIEKGWSDEAIAYDTLVKSWPRIEELAGSGDGRLFA